MVLYSFQDMLLFEALPLYSHAYPSIISLVCTRVMTLFIHFLPLCSIRLSFSYPEFSGSDSDSTRVKALGKQERPIVSESWLGHSGFQRIWDGNLTQGNHQPRNLRQSSRFGDTVELLAAQSPGEVMR